MSRTRRLLPAVTLIAVFAHAATAGGDQAASKALIQIAKGDRALAADNLRRAGEYYAKALEMVPDLPEGHLGMGRVYLQLRRFDEALTLLTEAERGYLNQSETLLRARADRYHRAHADAADVLRKVAMMQSNIELLEGAIADSGGRSAEAQRQKLRTLQQDVRRLETEARRLEKIAESAPTFDRRVPASVYFLIGNAQQNLGRLDEAVAAWEQCAELDPEFSLVHNNLAVGYWRLGRLELAAASVERAEMLGFEVSAEFKAELARSK